MRGKSCLWALTVKLRRGVRNGSRACLELGPRLVESAEAVLQHAGLTASALFGYPDDMKLRSSATLFASVSPAGSVFHRILDTFFQGRPDEATLRLLQSH